MSYEKLSVPKLSLDDAKKNALKIKYTCVSKKDMDVNTYSIKKRKELTDKVNNKVANMKDMDVKTESKEEAFTTISLMKQHPSVYINANIDDINKYEHQTSDNSEPILPIETNESIVFSPHLENASIMKLVIITVIVLFLTQVFITYRGIIYQFIDKLQSNQLVKTTFSYVF